LARRSWWQPTVACSAVDKMDLPCLPVNTTNYEHSLHPHEHASSLPSAARFLIARCPPWTAQETHSLRLVGVAPRPRSVVPASHYSFIASKLLLFFSSQPASQPHLGPTALARRLAALANLQRKPRRHSSPAARPSSPLSSLQSSTLLSVAAVTSPEVPASTVSQSWQLPGWAWATVLQRTTASTLFPHCVGTRLLPDCPNFLLLLPSPPLLLLLLRRLHHTPPLDPHAHTTPFVLDRRILAGCLLHGLVAWNNTV
jgi:hypothetical protein